VGVIALLVFQKKFMHLPESEKKETVGT